MQLIFSLYLDGWSCRKIAEYLKKKKIPSKRGASIWQDISILFILKNEKYAGDLLLGKTITVNAIITKRKRNHGEQEQYLVKNHHEAIISRDDF